MTDRDVKLSAVIAAIDCLSTSGTPGMWTQNSHVSVDKLIAAVKALPDAWRPIEEYDGQ